MYGWDDAGWEADGQPMRFRSVEEAQAEIDEFVSDCAAEGMDYGQEDYRVRPSHDPEIFYKPKHNRKKK